MTLTELNHELFRELREKAGLSREDLIFKLREAGHTVSLRTMASYESGETSPDADALPLFAHALGVDVIAFYKKRK